jgi:hypothetical protein
MSTKVLHDLKCWARSPFISATAMAAFLDEMTQVDPQIRCLHHDRATVAGGRIGVTALGKINEQWPIQTVSTGIPVRHCFH